MEKDIKEQLEKLQYYGEFYAKSDIDDKIKLEELDKTGEISEFGRNFSPQVDHKYTMVISDRRSYLLGNGRGGKDFTNFLTTLEKLDNEKYLGLRESLETDPARYHIYTHRGDLLEAFDGVYDEELQSIGNNFGEVYEDVNEAIKRGEVDLTDYPNLERAFDDYELKILDKEIWERDNNYVKFYMDNAYEYLNEKNVLLEYSSYGLEKYNDILKDGRDSYLDVKDMLIEEGVIDKNRYDELLEEKAEFDKNEEIARKNIEKIMDDEEFVNSIMDSVDKYILKQVYFVNKNEFSTMDFIDDGFDDTYIKFSDGEKVLVGPNVNNAKEDLAKFTVQAKLYGEFSRNNKYKDYKVNLDSDYGVRLSDMTKPYSDLVLIRPDEYNKDTGNFDMRFKLSDTKFILMNDYELLSSIATDNMNDVKRNFIEDVQLRDEVNYEVEGLGKVEHETWKTFQSIDSGVTNVDNDHYEFEFNDTLEFNKCVHADDIHKLDYLDETIKKFNEHSFVVENVEYLDKNVHDSEEMLKFMVNNDMLDQAKYEQKVEDYKEYRFEKIIDSLSNKKQDNTLEM